MNTTFSSVLDKPANTIERLPPLPTGTYLCLVSGQPRFDESSSKKTKFVEWILLPKKTADDVDTDALAEAGGLEGKKLRRTIYYQRADGEEIANADYQIREFVQHCGVDTDVQTKLSTLISETPNKYVIAKIKHVPTQDGKGMQAEISSTAVAE